MMSKIIEHSFLPVKLLRRQDLDLAIEDRGRLNQLKVSVCHAINCGRGDIAEALARAAARLCAKGGA